MRSNYFVSDAREVSMFGNERLYPRDGGGGSSLVADRLASRASNKADELQQLQQQLRDLQSQLSKEWDDALGDHSFVGKKPSVLNDPPSSRFEYSSNLGSKQAADRSSSIFRSLDMPYSSHHQPSSGVEANGPLFKSWDHRVGSNVSTDPYQPFSYKRDPQDSAAPSNSFAPPPQSSLLSSPTFLVHSSPPAPAPPANNHYSVGQVDPIREYQRPNDTRSLFRSVDVPSSNQRETSSDFMFRSAQMPRVVAARDISLHEPIGAAPSFSSRFDEPRQQHSEHKFSFDRPSAAPSTTNTTTATSAPTITSGYSAYSSYQRELQTRNDSNPPPPKTQTQESERYRGYEESRRVTSLPKVFPLVHPYLASIQKRTLQEPEKVQPPSRAYEPSYMSKFSQPGAQVDFSIVLPLVFGLRVFFLQ